MFQHATPLLQACRVPPPPQRWRLTEQEKLTQYQICPCDVFVVTQMQLVSSSRIRGEKTNKQKPPKTNTKSDNMETHQCQSYNKKVKNKKKIKKYSYWVNIFMFEMIIFLNDPLFFHFKLYIWNLFGCWDDCFPLFIPNFVFYFIFFYNWHFICRGYLQIWSFNIIICIL